MLNERAAERDDRAEAPPVREDDRQRAVQCPPAKSFDPNAATVRKCLKWHELPGISAGIRGKRTCGMLSLGSGTAFITSGYALPFLIAVALCVCLWLVARGLESKDLKELILGLSEHFCASVVGWILFVVASVVYFLLLIFVRRQYEAEIERQRVLIEKLLPHQSADNLKLE
jgi:hypothetical protein